MKPTRLCLSLFVLATITLLTLAPFGNAAAQTGGTLQPTPLAGDPVVQPGGPADGANPAADLVLAYSGCTRVNVSTINDYYEQRVVELTNIQRANNGQPPLKRITDLDYAARYHAKDMMDENYFAHDTYDGQGGATYVCNFGTRLAQFYTGDGYKGENIAAGYGTPEDVVNGWMDSSGHRENILRPQFREIGVGYYTGGGTYSSYWVQDFGWRSGYFPLIINNEAYSTNTNVVNIYLYGQGTWAEMRLSTDGANWGAWQPFQTSFSYTVPCILGTTTVYAQMRAAGHVNPDTATSDSIIIQGATCNTFGHLPDYSVFLYDQSKKELTPANDTLRPANTTSPTALTWTVTKSGFSSDWLALSTSSGSTPNGAVTAVASNVNSVFDTLGNYSGTLTFKASCSTGELVNNATVPVKVVLAVVPKVEKTYLPAIGHP